MDNPEKSLQARVRDWLLGEGYPLEFRAAREFRKRGFSVRQGVYAKSENESPREVDVIAYGTVPERIRVYHVIECKWSQDKPWVVLTAEGQQMAESACVNQAISSLLGRSLVWILAGDHEVASLKLFASPVRPGFSGRQAFSKGNDLFYAAVQSVVSKAKAIVDEYDDHTNLDKRIPEWGAVAFPVIVLRGGLFEGYMDWTTGDLVVESAKHLRVHWRGSDVWAHHATVDVVSEDYIEEFAHERADDTNVLLEKMRCARTNVETCWSKSSLADLHFGPAPRGTTGLPELLHIIHERERAANPRRARVGAANPKAEDEPSRDKGPDQNPN